MYRAGLTVFITCLINICSAQTIIKVRSFEDQLPIPYASVVNLTKNQLYFSDANGIVSAKFEAGDSIFISCIGYQNRKDRIDTNGSRTYLLKQSNMVLEPVKILSCKNVVTHEYSNLIADSSERKFGGVGWSRNARNAKVAVMLIPGFDNARLKDFSIWLQKGMEGIPKIAIQAPIIFSFHNVADTSLLPGELISNQRVIHFPKKVGRQTIKIDTLDISIPKSGIYVCMEYVYDDRYQYPMRFVDEKKGIDSIFMKYGGLIDGVFSRDFTLAFYNYQTDNWSFPLNKNKATVFEIHGTIKFSATLTYCSTVNKQ